MPPTVRLGAQGGIAAFYCVSYNDTSVSGRELRQLPRVDLAH
jgi:hypothetical protein